MKNLRPALLSFSLILVLSVGCSSSQSKKQTTTTTSHKEKSSAPATPKSSNVEERVESEGGSYDEFDEEVEALMLSLPQLVPYKEHQDQFKIDEDDNKASTALSRETLAKTNAVQIEKLSESQDPIDKGLALCELKKFDEGLKWLDKNYHSFKKHPPYWNAVGVCYLKQGQIRTALLYLNKAIETNEQYAPAWNNLGVINLLEGKDQTALVAFEKASGLNKFSQTPNYNLAFLYLQYGLIEKAEKLFLSLLQNSSKDTELRIGLAISQLMLKKIETSVQSFNAVDSELWERPDVGLNYALALYMGNARERARKVLSRVEISKDARYRDYQQRLAKYIGGDDE